MCSSLFEALRDNIVGPLYFEGSTPLLTRAQTYPTAQQPLLASFRREVSNSLTLLYTYSKVRRQNTTNANKVVRETRHARSTRTKKHTHHRQQSIRSWERQRKETRPVPSVMLCFIFETRPEHDTIPSQADSSLFHSLGHAACIRPAGALRAPHPTADAALLEAADFVRLDPSKTVGAHPA